MTIPTQPERFHALDATRAFALLLGIVFHAAWSFIPAPMGGPIVDAAAQPVFDWFFFTSHTFRMQLFFLIAGFFAHLVFHRQGPVQFARNRLLRIGVPLVLGWLILYPLIVAAWSAGANLSGRNLVELPLSMILSRLYRGLILLPRHLGGSFGLAHLWFLYYLLCLYALVLGARYFLTRSDPIAARLRDRSDAWVDRAMRSPGSILWLSLGLGFFLWPMGGWFGVDTPVRSPVPSLTVLLFYGSFFVLGWLLHRQAALLTGLTRHWRWQLPVGLALSIPLFAVYQSVRDRGAAGSLLVHYPGLEAAQITDWPAFLNRLQSARDPSAVPVELSHLWGHLQPGAQRRILALTDQANPDERAGVAAALGKLLPQPAMFRSEEAALFQFPPVTEARRALIQNRLELERLFAGSLSGDPLKLIWYRSVKLAYSIGYGLVMWLLLFGTLGFFQARCTAHSPAWRYIADSSYWIYLVHLPLVAALQVWMASWPWPGIIKFLLLSAVTFLILFSSYHYLVRSTFIGRLLNGRSYPLVAWPWRTASTEPDPAASSTITSTAENQESTAGPDQRSLSYEHPTRGSHASIGAAGSTSM